MTNENEKTVGGVEETPTISQTLQSVSAPPPQVESVFTESWRERRSAYRTAAANALIDADLATMDETSKQGLFRAATRALFDFDDPDGRRSFGSGASKNWDENIERLRRFVKGDFSAIETDDMREWEALGDDEEKRFRHALKHEAWTSKQREWLKGNRKSIQVSARGQYGQEIQLGLPDFLFPEKDRERNYDSLSEEEKAQYRKNVIDSYEKTLLQQSPAATFMKMTYNLSDTGTYLVSKAYNSGNITIDELKHLEAPEREQVLTALSLMRGYRKRGKILGVETDFTDETKFNRFQLNLYGFLNSLLSLASDTADFGKSAWKWARYKMMTDEAQMQRYKEDWDLEQQIERALDLPLPEGGFWGAMTQGVAENVHWFIPYGAAAKGAGKIKTAKEVMKTLRLTETAAKANALTAMTAVRKAEIVKDAAAVEKYTAALRLALETERTAQAGMTAAQRMLRTGRAISYPGMMMAYSAFAEEYLDNADAAGISRTESLPTAAAVGALNAAIERFYVPGLESRLTPAQIKSVMWSSLREAWNSAGAAGARKKLAEILRVRAAEGARVFVSEGLFEEPLQQITTEMGKAVDAKCAELRKTEGGMALAEACREAWEALTGDPLGVGKNGFAAAWGIFIDTAAEVAPSSLGFGLTTIGFQTNRQHVHNYLERRKTGDNAYEAGYVDMVSRVMASRKAIRDYWEAQGLKADSTLEEQLTDALSRARDAFRRREGAMDVDAAIREAAGVDARTAGVIRDMLEIEENYELASPRYRAWRNAELTNVAEVTEDDVKALLPGYVEGSFKADRENGVFSAQVKLPGVEEPKTIAYRIVPNDELFNPTDEDLADDSPLGVSYETRRNGDEKVAPWSKLSMEERRTAARSMANSILRRGGETIEFTNAEGKTERVDADAVIALANGRIADVAFRGAMARGSTLRHETWHALWRFTRSTLPKSDVDALYTAFPHIDPKSKTAAAELDEAIAAQFELYASGNYVPPALATKFERWTGIGMKVFGKILDALGAGRSERVVDPATGKPFTLQGFYDAVLAGRLGTGALGITHRATGAEEKKETPAAPEEATAEEATPEEAKTPGKPAPEPVPEATLENPASPNVPDQRFYRINAGNGVSLVGELVVSDAADLHTSYKGNLTDPRLQNRGETNEGKEKVLEIASGPDPLQVGTVQPRANNGFTWALPNGDVFIGNTRVSGISQAYENGNAEAVRAYMLEEARRRGITVREGVENPIVHFVLRSIESKDGSATIYDVVRQTNESINRGMNVEEQAKNDSDLIEKLNIAPDFAFTPDGRIDTEASREAINAFARESGAQGMIDPSTKLLTDAGQKRLANAIVVNILGSAGSLLSRRDDLDVENELRALTRMAPRLMHPGAKLLSADFSAYDLRGALAEIMPKYAEWLRQDKTARVKAGKQRKYWYKLDADGNRAHGVSWERFISQGDLFEEPSDAAKQLGQLLADSRKLRSFDSEDAETEAGRIRAQKHVVDFFTRYFEQVDKIDPSGVDLFGEPPISREALMRNIADSIAREEAEAEGRFSVSAAALRRDYDEVVARYTNADGTKKRGWMKAPNGRPTLLDERQWVLVRTPAFKAWFGDWEATELQRWLEGSPVAHATGKEYEGMSRSEIVNAVFKNWERVNHKVVNNDVGEVELSRSGIHDSMAHGIGRNKLAAFDFIPEIIANGRVVRFRENWEDRGYDSHIIAAPISIGGKPCVALAIVNRSANGNRFYLHEVGIIDEIKKYAEAFRTGSSDVKSALSRNLGDVRSIAYSLFAVKGASRAVDENGEPMVVYHGTRWNPLAEAPGNAVFGKSNTASQGTYLKNRQGFFFANKEVAENYGVGSPAAFFINTRNPYVVDVRDELRELDYDIETEREEAEAAGYPIGRWLGEGHADFEANDSATAYLDDNMDEIMDRADVSKADAVLVRGADGSFVAVAFEPTQIKSATDNTGAFDGGEGDIRASVAAAALRRDYDAVVARYTNADGTKKRGWMKAPNGRPTLLDERQWVLVRTPTFKEWFGDWEAAAEIAPAGITEAKAAFKELMARNAELTTDDGSVLRFVSQSAKAYSKEAEKESSDKPAHWAALANIERLVSRSRFMFEEKPRNGSRDIDAYMKYGAVFTFNDQSYLAKITSKRYPDRNAQNFYSVESVSVEKIAARGIHEAIAKGQPLDASDNDRISKILESVKGASRVVDEIKKEAERLDDTGLSPDGAKVARPLGSLKSLAKNLFAVKGASRAVDENGEPLVVYHGTNAEFNAFEGGAFFTDDYMNADGYANGERVLECFLDIKNPLVVDCKGRKWDELDTPYGKTTRAVVASEEAKKHGGVVFKNVKDSWADDAEAQEPGTVFYVRNSAQAKSATDNTGAFDGAEGDIRASFAGERGAAVSPWETEDVPENEQIVRFSVARQKGTTAQGPLSESDQTPPVQFSGGATSIPLTLESAGPVTKFADIVSKDGVKSPAEFLTGLVHALGSTETNPDKTQYFDIAHEDGKTLSLRIANHRATAAQYREHGNTADVKTSIVVKTSDKPFKADRDVKLTEHVYFSDKLTAEREAAIARAVAAWIATGEWRGPAADQVNTSPGAERFSVAPVYTGSAADYANRSRQGGVDANKIAGLNLEEETDSLLRPQASSDHVSTPGDFTLWQSTPQIIPYSPASRQGGAADVRASFAGMRRASRLDLDWARGSERFSVAPVYTGSAADYANRSRQGGVDDGPSVKHIGTGEGSQVYGWGLYGSTVRGVAEGYAQQDAKRKRYINFKGKQLTPDELDKLPEYQHIAEKALQYMDHSVDYAIHLLKSDPLRVSKNEEQTKRAIEWLERNRTEIKTDAPYLYEQTFFTNRADGDESHLLKWHEPVTSEQIEWIAKEIANYDPTINSAPFVKSGLTGEDIYINLENFGKREYGVSSQDAPKFASELLRDAGIDGVKYPVDSFGGKGVKDGDKAGWNYVAFSDEHIRVDHKWTDGEQRFSVVTRVFNPDAQVAVVDGRIEPVFKNLATAEIRNYIRDRYMGREVTIDSDGTLAVFRDAELKAAMKKRGKHRRVLHALDALVKNAHYTRFEPNDGQEKHAHLIGQFVYTAAIRLADGVYGVELKLDIPKSDPEKTRFKGQTLKTKIADAVLSAQTHPEGRLTPASDYETSAAETIRLGDIVSTPQIIPQSAAPRQGGVSPERYTIRINPNLRSDVDAALVKRTKDNPDVKQDKRRKEILFSEDIPFFAAIGLPNLRVITEVANVRKLKEKHHLDPAAIAELPMRYNAPAAVFRDGDTSFVVLTDAMGETDSGIVKPVMVRFDLEERKSGEAIFLVSAYAREPHLEQEYIRLANTPGCPVFIDENKVAALNLEEGTTSTLRTLASRDDVVTPEGMTPQIIPQSAAPRQGGVRDGRSSNGQPERFSVAVTPEEDAAYMDAVNWTNRFLIPQTKGNAVKPQKILAKMQKKMEKKRGYPLSYDETRDAISLGNGMTLGTAREILTLHAMSQLPIGSYNFDAVADQIEEIFGFKPFFDEISKGAITLHDRFGDRYYTTTTLGLNEFNVLDAAQREDIRFSVASTTSGERFVLLDRQINDDWSDKNAVRKNLSALVGSGAISLADSARIEIGKELPKEYTRSNNAEQLYRNKRLRKIRGKLARHFDELITVSSDRSPDSARDKEREDGVYYYRNINFGVKGHEVARGYSAKLLSYTRKGVEYIYDIVDIKDNSSLSSALNAGSHGGYQILSTNNGEEFGAHSTISAPSRQGGSGATPPSIAPRFSVATIAGRAVAVAETEPLTTAEAQDEAKVRELLSNIIGQSFPQRGEAVPVQIDDAFADEFWNSNYSEQVRRKREKLWRVKVSTMPLIGDILATTSLGPAEAARHINKKFKERAVFYRCPAEFGVKRWDGVAIYSCEVLILEVDGNRYVYDIVNMKKPTLAAKDSLDEETLRRLYSSGTRTEESASSAPIGNAAYSTISPASRQGGAADVRASFAKRPFAFDGQPLKDPHTLYQQMNRLDDVSLYAAALACKMAVSGAKSVKESTVVEKLHDIYPERKREDLARMAFGIKNRAEAYAKRIKEDLNRGVTESAIVKHIPDDAREAFAGEIRDEALRGRNLGAFGQRVSQEIRNRQAKVFADAVKVQTGMEASLFESFFGFDLASTIEGLANNPYLKRMELKDEERRKKRMEQKAAQKKDAAAQEEAGAGEAEEDAKPELPALSLEDPHALAMKLVDMCREYWNAKHGFRKEYNPFSHAVALQFLRKTLANIYSKLADDLVYSRMRETVRNHIAKLENCPTVRGIEGEATFLGQLINAKRIRQTAQELCEQLSTFLKTKFEASGQFDPAVEELKRRVPAVLQRMARYARHAIWLTPEAAMLESAELQKEIAAATQEFDEFDADSADSRIINENTLKLNVLREFGALKYKPIAQIEEAIAWWENAQDEGAEKIFNAWNEREKRTERIANILAAAFRNPSVKARFAKEGRSFTDVVNDYLQGHMGFINLLRDLMRFAPAAERAAAGEYLRQIELEIQKAGTRAETAKRNAAQELVRAAEEIYGKPFAAVLRDMVKVDERFMPFMGQVDNGKTVAPTKGRAMQLLASLLQLGRRVSVRDLETGEDVDTWIGGYWDNIVANGREGQAEKIAALLTTEDMNMLAWMRGWYERNRQSLSDISQRIFGVGVYAETGNYMPVKMLVDPQGLEKATSVGWSVFPKSLTPRVRNLRDFDTSADVFQMFFSRMHEAEQWKAHVELGLELRGIFGRSELQKALRASHGDKARRLLLGFITDILAGHGAAETGADGVRAFTDTVRGWAAVGALGGNLGVMLKQPTSIPAFAFEIGLKKTATLIASAFSPAGLEAMGEIWRSQERVNRWHGGYSEEIANALRDKNPGPLKKALLATMVTNRLGDIVPALVVGQGIYRDYLAQGYSKEDAMAATWILVERTQQSSRIENRAGFQRRHPLGNTIYQFLTTQQQYLQYEIIALREAINEPRNSAKWTKFATATVLNHFILSSAYFWMGQLYRALLGQPPPKEQLQDWVIAMLLGPYGALYGLGITSSDAISEWVKGYKFGKGQSIPSLSFVGNIFVRDPHRIVAAMLDKRKSWSDVLDETGRWISDFNSLFRDARKVYRYRIKGEK